MPEQMRKILIGSSLYKHLINIILIRAKVILELKSELLLMENEVNILESYCSVCEECQNIFKLKEEDIKSYKRLLPKFLETIRNINLAKDFNTSNLDKISANIAKESIEKEDHWFIEQEIEILSNFSNKLRSFFKEMENLIVTEQVHQNSFLNVRKKVSLNYKIKHCQKVAKKQPLTELPLTFKEKIV